MDCIRPACKFLLFPNQKKECWKATLCTITSLVMGIITAFSLHLIAAIIYRCTTPKQNKIIPLHEIPLPQIEVLDDQRMLTEITRLPGLPETATKFRNKPRALRIEEEKDYTNSLFDICAVARSPGHVVYTTNQKTLEINLFPLPVLLQSKIQIKDSYLRVEYGISAVKNLIVAIGGIKNIWKLEELEARFQSKHFYADLREALESVSSTKIPDMNHSDLIPLIHRIQTIPDNHPKMRKLTNEMKVAIGILRKYASNITIIKYSGEALSSRGYINLGHGKLFVGLQLMQLQKKLSSEDPFFHGLCIGNSGQGHEDDPSVPLDPHWISIILQRDKPNGPVACFCMDSQDNNEPAIHGRHVQLLFTLLEDLGIPAAEIPARNPPMSKLEDSVGLSMITFFNANYGQRLETKILPIDRTTYALSPDIDREKEFLSESALETNLSELDDAIAFVKETDWKGSSQYRHTSIIGNLTRLAQFYAHSGYESDPRVKRALEFLIAPSTAIEASIA